MTDTTLSITKNNFKTSLAAVCGLFLLILCGSATVPPAKSALYVSDYDNVLGTSLQLKIAAPSADKATIAENAAMNEIDRLNKILSGYDAASEFSKWVRTQNQAVKVSPELFEVLSLFDKWRVQSNGALDASAEVVGKVWKDAAKRGAQPTREQLAEAVALLKQKHWVLDEVNHTATHLDNVPLMLNSFAKSYVMNKACDAALSTGVNGLVMNIGGDIMVRGDHTEQIQVSNPKADAENDAPIAMLSINNKFIATSGNYRRGELVNGQWHSHIVDPRTGLPADKIISATVVADNATDAGALATAFNVLNPDESATLAKTVSGAEYMIVTSDGKTIESKGWKNLEITLPKAALPTKSTGLAADKTWDPKYELVINLELAEIEGMRVHRPYVAVWVVDKDKKPVRSIALWYNKPKYLNDMHSWYDTYYSAFVDGSSNISSTTSATRPAGKYTLKWDGKNDKGDYVKKDTYTIMLEVAREHGTYQLMTQEIDFNKKIKPITLTPNVEVASASLDYQKKTDGQ
jgi:thiamine biosynthesis lipoprotein ApbE